MDTWQRRLGYYLSIMAAVIFGYTFVYHFGMHIFENESVSFLHSLQVVVETFTTTGFGSDSPWESPQMNLIVIVMDLTGVFLFFLALPVFVFPLLQDVLSTTVPTNLDTNLTDHVIICTYTPRSETLISELESWNVDYVIVEPSREQATDLYENGYRVIHEQQNSVSGLTAARVTEARAVVADVSDEMDTSIVLTVKEIAEDVRVVSVVEEPERATYHELAGADVVLSPRTLLGESLAHKVTTAVTTDLGDAIEVGADFDIVELPVHRGSDLAGKTLTDSGLRERAGVNVIGAWFQGEFQTPPSPTATLESGTVLLVTGKEDQLERLKDMTVSDIRQFTRGESIVVGFGEVGQTITSVFDEHDVSYTVIDQRNIPGVDIVGDATDPVVFEQAGIMDAQSVILAVPDDTTAEFSTLVIRDLNPTTEIISRTEHIESVQKMYRAGADYVLSLATVSGRMMASAVLEDEEVISLDTKVEVIRTQAPGLVGRSLGEANVRSETGCTVVAVERDGTLITDVGPDFVIHQNDELIIAGTDEGTNRFTDQLG